MFKEANKHRNNYRHKAWLLRHKPISYAQHKEVCTKLSVEWGLILCPSGALFNFSAMRCYVKMHASKRREAGICIIKKKKACVIE